VAAAVTSGGGGGVDVGRCRWQRGCRPAAASADSSGCGVGPVAAAGRLQRPVTAATACDGGCGAATAADNGGCGVRWRLQRPVTAEAGALVSAGCSGTEARVLEAEKKSSYDYHVRGEG
jgi:hypothetical protein